MVHFCWDNLLGRQAAVVRWRQLTPGAGDGSQACVPCGVLHSGPSQLAFHRRVLRIAGFQWWWLLPTASGKALRSLASYGSRAWREATPETKVCASREQRLKRLWWGSAATTDQWAAAA